MPASRHKQSYDIWVHECNTSDLFQTCNGFAELLFPCKNDAHMLCHFFFLLHHLLQRIKTRKLQFVCRIYLPTHTHTHTHSDLSIYARHAQVWLCEHTHTCTRTRTSCTNAHKQLHASRNCALWYLHMHTYKQRLKCAAFTLNFGHVSLQIGVILCRAMAKANETAVSGQTVGCRHCNKVDSIEKETCKLRVRTFVLCLSCCAIRSISSSLA